MAPDGGLRDRQLEKRIVTRRFEGTRNRRRITILDPDALSRLASGLSVVGQPQI